MINVNPKFKGKDESAEFTGSDSVEYSHKMHVSSCGDILFGRIVDAGRWLGDESLAIRIEPNDGEVPFILTESEAMAFIEAFQRALDAGKR